MTEFSLYGMTSSDAYDLIEEEKRYNECKEGFSAYVLEIRGGEEKFIPVFTGAYDVKGLSKDCVEELNKLIETYNTMTAKYHYSLIKDSSFVEVMKWSRKESIAYRNLNKFVKNNELNFYKKSVIDNIEAEVSQER